VAWGVNASGIYSTQHDHHFEKYSRRYFGVGFDWTWWKCQAMAESAMDSTAKSYCGAEGIMQIMPGTWNQIAAKIDVSSPWIVKDAINAGIYYDARMWAVWTARRPLEQRVFFTLASYNAGAGNIVRAQRLVPDDQDENAWEAVGAQLHRITGHHHRETLGYVERIRRFHQEILDRW
jgi:membrane-bound lytic murein transglycosylase F